MDKTLTAGATISFIVAIVLISLVISNVSAVVGYGILFVWLICFGIFMWIFARRELEKTIAENESRLAALDHPDIYQHSFDYLCPACLFQTNENTGLCPRCGRRELVETYKHPLDAGKKRFGEEDEDEEHKHVPL